MATGAQTTTFPFHDEMLKFLAGGDPTRTLGSLQEQMLEAVRQSQDAILELAHTWADATASLVPQIPAFPLVAQIPATVELVESTLNFFDGILSAQKDFTAGLGPAG